jgi:hypothetical protein
MKTIFYTWLVCTIIVFTFAYSKAQEPDPASFFPTTVGNMILYQNHNNPNPDFLVELYKDSIDDKGNHYVSFDGTSAGNGLPSFSRFKIDNDLNVYYLPDRKFDTLELLFKLKAETGDYWNIYESEEQRHIYQVLSKKYKANVHGVPTTIMEVDWYSYSGDPSVLSVEDWKNKGLWAGRYALASGFGIIAAYGEPDEHVPVYAIKGAIINGDTLGDFKMHVSVAEENDKANILTAISLMSSPNPFAEHSGLSFSLSQPEYIKLTVKNLLGETVAVLAEGFFAKGYYTREFHGENLPDGMYICALETQQQTLIQKLMLQR